MATRHAGYDNCKNLFIFYVVLIHLCNFPLIEWKQANADWPLVYTRIFQTYTLWHEKLSVPGFVFMSGYFGKGFLPKASSGGKKDDIRWEKTISVLLVGTAFLQLAYFVLGTVLSRTLIGDWLELPNWLLLFDRSETWYLVALFLWRISTPVIGRLQYPFVSSFLLALVSTHAQFGGPMDMR